MCMLMHEYDITCVVCGDDLTEKERSEKQGLASVRENLFNAIENVIKEIDDSQPVQ